MSTPAPTLWDRFSAWLGSGAMVEQSAQNATLPQAYQDQTFFCPNTGTTVTSQSPEQTVECVQSQYTATNNDTINHVLSGLDWLLKLLETYFILAVIILAVGFFLYLAYKSE
jgi:hypothetical protein